MAENTKEQGKEFDDTDIFDIEETHADEKMEPTSTPGFDGKVSMATAQRLAKFAKNK